MSAYTLALLAALIVLVGVLLVARRRSAAGSSGRVAVSRAHAETAATAAPPAPTGPMPLSPPSSEAAVAGAWGMPSPDADAEPSPFDPSPAMSWGDDEIVTAPGWPLPGELDLGWSGPAAAPNEPAPTLSMPAAPAAVSAPVSAMPAAPAADAAVDAAMPRWQPTPPDDAAEMPSGPPTLSLDAPDDDEDVIVWADAEEPGLAMPSWEAPAPHPVVPPAPAPTPAPRAEPEPDLGDDGLGVPEVAWLETAAAAAPTPEAIGWDDPPSDEAPRPAAGLRPYGRFVLGGFAYTPGHQAVAGVTFAEPVASAPARWLIGPAADAPAGSLVLELEGLVNCTGEDVDVMEAPGFGPTDLGFTVRVTARDAGPFAAAGTYRII